MSAGWVRPLEQPPSRWGHSAVLHHHQMLVFGGVEGSELNNDVVLFDLQPPAAHCKGIFSSGGSEKAPAPRVFHSAVLWHSQMVVFGGWSGKVKAPVNDLHVWDCDKQTWSGNVETIGTPPSPRMSHSAVVHGDRMVIFGGQNEIDRNAEIHILSISRQPAWSGPINTQGQVPRPVSSHTACLYGDKMIVYGDNGESSAIFCLDLAVSKLVWRHIEAKGEVPQPRISHTATMVANNMILLGGERICTDARQNPFANEHCVLDLTTTPATWKRLPSEGSVPAARHMHTAVFHSPTMCLFMFGGTQTPSVQKKNIGRVRSLLSTKGILMRGLHILPLGFLITPTSTALPLDCAFQSIIKNMKQVRGQRAWFKDRIPQQFLRLAAFLQNDKVDCISFIQDISQAVACLERVTKREANLLQLQMRIRTSGSSDSKQSVALPKDWPDPTTEALVKARNEARATFLQDAEELVALVHEIDLSGKLEGMLVTHLGNINSILALWDTDSSEDKNMALINAKENVDSNDLDVRLTSFMDAMQTCELILNSFLLDEARVADELRRHTDGVARRLQYVLLHNIHDFMGSPGTDNLDDMRSDDGGASDETPDTLVRMVENLAAEEEIWFSRQPARAEPLVPQSRRVVRQLLRTLHCFESIAQSVLSKVTLLEKTIASIKQHATKQPQLDDFTQLVDEVDCAQRDFCLAFAELDSLRKLRRRDAERIAASEKKVAEVRRKLQTVQRREEVERMKLAIALHEHWPEMLTLHPDLKLREVLDRCRAEDVDSFLLSERSLEDYDIQGYNTNGRHVVLQAKFEDQEYALKEYVIQDLATVKHEVRILTRLQHPHIMPCQALVVSESEMKAYLQLPYYGHSMMEWVSTGMATDEEIRALSGQVLSALSYLHSRGVMHGNVRLENVLLDRHGNRAVLADFDVSKPSTERAVTVATSSTTPNGSVAPEVVAGGCGTTAADMWAFGYMLVMAQLRGRRPEHAIPQDLAQVMRTQPFATQLVDVLDNLFIEDPGRRLTADAALLYRWFVTTGLISEKERLRRAVAEVQRDRDLLRRGAIQLQVDRQAYRELLGLLLERVEALTGRSAELVAGRAVHINTAQRLIFDLATDGLNGDLKALADQWVHLADTSDRLERLSREFVARQRDVERKEQTIMLDKHISSLSSSDPASETPNQATCRLFGLPPIYWMATGIRNMNPLVDITDTWLAKMQDLVTSTESAVKHGRGRQYRRHLVIKQVFHVESCALWESYCAARDVVHVRVAQAVQSGHHTLLMALNTGREWMQDLQLDSTINEKLLFCACPRQFLDRARLGFGVDEKFKTSGNLGYGIYFTTSASKAEAAKQHEGENGESDEDAYLILGRVCLGCPLTIGDPGKDTRRPPCLYRCHETTACAHPCYDSIVHDPDYATYNSDLCYPEYILRYKVISQEEVWSLDAVEEDKAIQQPKSTALKFTPVIDENPHSYLMSPGSFRQASPLREAINGLLFTTSPASSESALDVHALADRKPSLLDRLGPTSFKLGLKHQGSVSTSQAKPAAGTQRAELSPTAEEMSRENGWPHDGHIVREGPLSELSRAIHRRMGGDPGWKLDWSTHSRSAPTVSEECRAMGMAAIGTSAPVNRKPGPTPAERQEEIDNSPKEADDPLSSPRQSLSDDDQSLYTF